jgi:nucleoside-diphosphate-sugar epimerase
MEKIKAKVQNVLHKDGSASMGKSGVGKTVLVSGGSGYVAGNVLHAFLSRGYNVKTTVRNDSSAEKIKKAHAKYVDQLSFAINEDVQKPGGFDEAVKGVDGVIHTASPFVMHVEHNKQDLLDPAIHGTEEILNSIIKYNPNVKRVVITSSFAAILDMDKGPRPGYTYTEKDWNPVTYEIASKDDTDGGVAYCASKTFAERAAWDFVEKNKPNFSVATLCPPMVYGPAVQNPTSLDHLNTSSADIYRLCDGSEKEVPETQFYAFVDDRDLGEAHVRAYENPAAAGQRYLITSSGYTYQQVCDIIRRDFPELKDRTPEGTPGAPFPDVYKLSNEKAKRDLGMTFRSLETTIHDMVKEFLVVEKEMGTK